jgi:hypothetical protein
VVSTLGQSVVIRLLGRVLFIDRPKNSVGLNGFAEGERRVADRSGCAVDEAGAFADQRFALAARPPGVFRLERRDRRHRAVIAFAPQPAEKGSFQRLDIQPIGLRPAVLA